MKALYEEELRAARQLLDETAKENAQLKLEKGKLNGIVADISPKLEEEKLTNRHLQGKVRVAEKNLKEKEITLGGYVKQIVDLQVTVWYFHFWNGLLAILVLSYLKKEVSQK